MTISADSSVMTARQAEQRAATQPVRPFYWSVRRELWEHRSVVVAPLAVAALTLFGFAIRITHLAQTVRSAAHLTPLEQRLELAAPFGIAGGAIGATGLIVALLYCLGALHNERRDRSILFWKSLPVSNLTAVLSKAFIPLVIQPLLVSGVVIATQLIMLLFASAVLLANGLDSSTLWTDWPFVKMAIAQIYGLLVLTLWYAPIYGWLLLVSGWARSKVVLWAVLPLLGLSIVERIAFETSYVSSWLNLRIGGFVPQAFNSDAHARVVNDPLVLLTPARFLSTPELWIGLVLAAVFLTGAVWFRRNRDPI
jgi:ABC-2 type transport system permease protein